MILIQQVDDKYRISFKYDANIVFMIKQVPGKLWNPEEKYWTIPLDRLGFFLAQLKGTPYQTMVKIFSNEHLNEDESLPSTSTADIPDVNIDDIHFYVKSGCYPYNHQLDFMKYAINRQYNGLNSGFLLLDEQGLGKTLEALNLALHNKQEKKFKHCLIICCINSAKYVWKYDILKHTDEEYDPYILGTRLTKKGDVKQSDISSVDKLDDLMNHHIYGNEAGDDLPYFIVTNIESLRYRSGKKYPITEAIISLINSGYINMIMIDEIHKNMSPSSIQGKQILEIKKKTDTKCMWIPITGTPIVNRPLDLYLPLRLVDAHHYTDFWNWSRNFCIYGGFGGKEVIGYKNIPVLKNMLKNHSIRRLRQDVLDLPPKIDLTEYVDNTSYQNKLYTQYAEELKDRKEDCVKSLNPLVQFMKLRQVNGSPEIVDENLANVLESGDVSRYIKCNAKLQRLLEILEDIHERGEKVVIFSNWVAPLRTIYKIISKKYKVCCFVGTMKDKVRQRHKDVFVNNPNYTVLLGTIEAAGVSLTLTVANNVIFYDCPWNMASFNQASDRCFRIGTTKSVNIYKLITRNTVDERVDNILFKKGKIANFIVDSIDIHSNPELFDLLLSDTYK